MHGVRFTEMVSRMVSRIRSLVGILRSGGPHNPLPRSSSTTDDEHTVGHHHQPAELGDDAITEILLRLPPDEPSHLFTASLISKNWHQIIHDPVFNRRYREFHGTPPLLGFFRNIISKDYKLDPISHFIRTTRTAIPSCSPPMSAPRDYWMFLDSRHGRVLIESSAGRLVVWDPITKRQKQLPLLSQPWFCEPITGAVLCGVAECNHLNCHGGPFLVVSVGNNYEDNFIWARVYSSEIGAWSTRMVTIVANFSFADTKPSLLVKDALYFSIENGLQILKYDLGMQCLSVIDAPGDGGGIAVAAKDGELGFASVEDYDIHLWSRQQVGVGGTAEWVQHRVIKLMNLLRIPVQLFALDLIGFAEDAKTIFINTDGGIYILDIDSFGVRKIGMRGAYNVVVPFTSFYTPDLAALRFQFEPYE